MSNILIIEDDEFLAKSLKKYLECEGCQVTVAEDGEKGLKVAFDMNPNLILLDIDIPKLNGFQVLEKLHGHPTLSSIPVMMISNSGEDVEIKRSQELGIKDYIIKANIDLGEVVQKVRKILQAPPKVSNQDSVKNEGEKLEASTPPQSAPPKKINPRNHQGPKILFIEDDAFFSKLCVRDLEDNGFYVDLAKDGEEGLRKFKENKYDLIISDIIMPRVSGLDVLKRIREEKDPALAKIPVILLTNLYKKEDMEKSEIYRVDAYLVKTMTDIKDVVAKIKEVLKIRPI